MAKKPNLLIYEEQKFNVGQDTFIDSVADNGNAVVFEDNEETGYFYAVDPVGTFSILDALQIYNVANVIDKNEPSLVKILWNETESKAFLSINNYYHAVYDFGERVGLCRTGFPNSNGSWTKNEDRKLTDELVKELAK